MSNTAIKIDNLGKVYRLYKKPKDKLLDAFNFNFWKKDYYQEFWALRNIDLEIKKGERIGIIGRNGAGKSTLLKTILGNICPTEGSVNVNGKIQALMELGTGFHPEFTGRENIRASLAYQGLTSRQIADKEQEIIDFAELDEFIDQPIKTYSAGMYARLAFSTATVIEPDILIIDEVLGAGDAYFASKCIDRMKNLTNNYGATVLFVSHDMSSVEMLCDRAIWIERGRKIMDGPTMNVSKAYSQMVRERTAQRLKLKNSMMVNSKQSAMKIREKTLQLIVRVVYECGEPIKVSMVTMSSKSINPVIVKVGEPQDTSVEYDGFVLIDNSFSTWGKPVLEKGIYNREICSLKNSSSAIVYNVDGIVSGEDINICICWSGSPGSKARVEIYDGNVYQLVGILESSKLDNLEGEMYTNTNIKICNEIINKFLSANGIEVLEKCKIDKEYNRIDNDITKHSEALFSVADDNSNNAEIYSGAINIKKISFLNEVKQETSILTSFEKMYIRIDYEVNDNPLDAEFVVCIHRMGIIAMQAISGIDNKQVYRLNKGEKGTVYLEIPSLSLGKGDYLVSIGVFPPLNYKSLDTERTAYILYDRKYEIKVEQPEDMIIDLGMCRTSTNWHINRNL